MKLKGSVAIVTRGTGGLGWCICHRLAETGTNVAVAAVMKHQGSGHIVNISSITGLSPSGSSIAYAVSKAGLIHLTRCMAVGLAPGVLVNCIAPGYMEGTRGSKNLDLFYRARLSEKALLKRPVDKDDVAGQVVNLCCTKSITGQTLVMDSGRVFH